MRITILAFGAIALGCGYGCAFKNVSLPSTQTPEKVQVEPLKRSEYAVLGPVTGHGCAKYVALWPIPIWWTDGDDGFKIFSSSPESMARKTAMVSAIESAKGADTLLLPRYKEEGAAFGFWYSNICAVVIGKAISIKPDTQPGSRAKAKDE